MSPSSGPDHSARDNQPLSGGPAQRGLQLRDLVRAISGQWQNAPEIIVADAVDGLPFDAPPDAAGAFWQGKIYLVAGNIRSRDHAEFVLLHEAFGHYGLAGVLGDRIKPALRALYEENDLVRESADHFLRRNRGASIELAVEETLANMAGDQEKKLSGFQRLVVSIRNGLRAIGFRLPLTNNDVMVLMDSAKEFVLRGGRRPVATVEAVFSRTDISQSGFYSQLSRAAEQLPQQKGTPAQMLAMLKKAGAKEAEIAATGLDDFLQMAGESVTQQQIQEYLYGHGIQVQEKELVQAINGSDEWEVIRNGPGEFDVIDGSGNTIESGFQSRLAAEEFIQAERNNDGTKYQQHVLPGGENYRELLLTLPEKDYMEDYWGYKEELNRKYGSALDAAINQTDEENAKLKELAEKGKTEKINFKSGHYDQKNILAHVRFNARTDVEGKRVLFIEEIQSDWAQEGRKQGFTNKEDYIVREATPQERPGIPGFDWAIVDKAGNVQGFESSREKAHAFAKSLEKTGVHSAPFITRTDAWVSLAMKRMITYAAENGFDRIAWTTGAQQAERYDLSKKIEKITVMAPKWDGAEWTYNAWPVGGALPVSGGVNTLDDMESVVGKDATKKLLDMKPDAVGNRTLSGLDLQVGGDGMRSFYDVIVKKVASNVIKQIDKSARIVETNVDLSNRAKGEELEKDKRTLAFAEKQIELAIKGNDLSGLDRWTKTATECETRIKNTELELSAQKMSRQPCFDITDAIRARVKTTGLPLFSRTDISSSGFYSELSRSADLLPQEKGTPAQMLAMLKKAGAKEAEISATGLDDYLKMAGKTVTRQQIQEYLQNNGVQVQDVVLYPGGKQCLNSSDKDDMYAEVSKEMYGQGTGGLTQEQYDIVTKEAERRIKSENEKLKQNPPAKFGDYVTPGGKNYRELLLTLPAPVKMEEIHPDQEAVSKYKDQWDAVTKDMDYTILSDEEYRDKVSLLDDIHEKMVRDTASRMKQARGESDSFRSGHYDQPNILAHIRFNERTDAEGKRVLFIEEIQSDWAQQGRKQGFDKVKSHAITDDTGKLWANYVDKNLADAALKDLRERFPEERLDMVETDEFIQGVPSAPFVTKTDAWVSLAMKRMITYAAENGFDRIAWTTGEQQAARYDLSKQAKSVRVYNKGNGAWEITAESLAGDLMNIAENAPTEKLSNYIGKELAERSTKELGAKEGADYSGAALKIGGQGMHSFYDSIVPKVAKDILKKVGGGQLREVSLQVVTPKTTLDVVGQDGGLVLRTDYDSEAHQAARDNPGARVIPSPPVESSQIQTGFDITDEMRARVKTTGLPLFSRASDINAGGFNMEGQLPGDAIRPANFASRLHALDGQLNTTRQGLSSPPSPGLG